MFIAYIIIVGSYVVFDGLLQATKLRNEKKCDGQFGLARLGEIRDLDRWERLQELQEELKEAQKRLDVMRAIFRRAGSAGVEGPVEAEPSSPTTAPMFPTGPPTAEPR